MTTNRTIGLIGAFILLIGGQNIGGGTSGYLLAQDRPPPMPGQEQLEVLTRGPVHEAFAEPVPLEVEAGLTVSQPPPANIEEIPPAERPRGDNFVWVPGYWAWDADRSGYIWVSACWRAAPPNMYWVPGYWNRVVEVQPAERGGVNVRVGGLDIHVGGERAPVAVVSWEWVSGFWAPAGAQEIEYLPAPPAPMDLEPPGAAPYADGMWVPGCWYWRGDQYVRRPGYWLRQQPNWVWVPSHYRWTPRGYVFESGHWDYSLDRRGVLFAPVYFPRSVYSREGFVYTPSIAIDLGVLSVNLFAYPRYSHYYFGDYYDDAYLRVGIYPQFESQRRHTWYDPIYTYDRWHYGQTDNRWEEHQRQQYDSRRSDKNLRPARTYREMEVRTARMPEAQRRNVQLAQPIQTIVERKSSPLRFERINTDARQKISSQATDTHKLRDERAKWEATKSTGPEPASPRADRTATPPTVERGRTATPPVDRKGPEAPTVERGRTATPPVDRKGPEAPTVERGRTVAPPVERGRTTTPPVERKGPEAPTVERGRTVPPTVERGRTVTPPVEQSPAPVPPRQVHLTKPERVQIPASPPIAGKSGKTPGDVEKGPPARPNDEQKIRSESKAPPKADAKDKDTRKNEDNRKDK